MNCPDFSARTVASCGASDLDHVPSIEEMERYCFSRDFTSCRIFRLQAFRLRQPMAEGDNAGNKGPLLSDDDGVTDTAPAAGLSVG